MRKSRSIEIRIEGDDFTSLYGRPDLPTFHDNPDGTVELRDIPDATIIGRDYAAAVEAEGGTTWRGVRLTITRDNGGMQLNAAASNGVFRWELQPAHFWDGEGSEMFIGRLIETGVSA
ncbi:hypothetical protein MSTE_03584 [Mycobacteroides stephanolepidis]|uniref:Uncharacterized protein n=1 Tax=[Mycobacterium] stephanolepidis TaxID=1520670 RepID=A0A1Z4F124_9MYCO|nr:hypothetical protein [[Mycobacterium] stephanolepidis]BAX98884.1 hypothetical protein MSTE_03584 [[Mycobacterium] stephanolepidis]